MKSYHYFGETILICVIALLISAIGGWGDVPSVPILTITSDPMDRDLMGNPVIVRKAQTFTVVEVKPFGVPKAVTFGTKQKTVEVVPVIEAGKTTVSDVIEMNNAAYYEHKRSIVEFSHKKHNTQYNVSCESCHHEFGGNPLEELKWGYEVQNCIDCHSKVGRPPRVKKGAQKFSETEKMEYHAYAIHVNCKDCHKKANKASGTKSAPIRCINCHLK